MPLSICLVCHLSHMSLGIFAAHLSLFAELHVYSDLSSSSSVSTTTFKNSSLSCSVDDVDGFVSEASCKWHQETFLTLLSQRNALLLSPRSLAPVLSAPKSHFLNQNTAHMSPAFRTPVFSRTEPVQSYKSTLAQKFRTACVSSPFPASSSPPSSHFLALAASCKLSVRTSFFISSLLTRLSFFCVSCRPTIELQ